MWEADNIFYNNYGNFIKAYIGAELVWFRENVLNNEILIVCDADGVVYGDYTLTNGENRIQMPEKTTMPILPASNILEIDLLNYDTQLNGYPTEISNLCFLNKSLRKFVATDANLAGITSSTGVFKGNTALEEAYMGDMVSTPSVENMFYGCTALKTVSIGKLTKCKTFKSVFYNCSALERISYLDTSNATNVSNLFDGCTNLTDVPLLDCSKLTTATSGLFNRCKSLTNLGGFTNLKYSLVLTDSDLITRESMINIFNTIANVTASRSIEISQTVYNRLTADDIAIAINKGWTVSIS